MSGDKLTFVVVYAGGHQEKMFRSHSVEDASRWMDLLKHLESRPNKDDDGQEVERDSQTSKETVAERMNAVRYENEERGSFSDSIFGLNYSTLEERKTTEINKIRNVFRQEYMKSKSISALSRKDLAHRKSSSSLRNCSNAAFG